MSAIFIYKREYLFGSRHNCLCFVSVYITLSVSRATWELLLATRVNFPHLNTKHPPVTKMKYDIHYIYGTHMQHTSISFFFLSQSCNDCPDGRARSCHRRLDIEIWDTVTIYNVHILCIDIKKYAVTLNAEVRCVVW